MQLRICISLSFFPLGYLCSFSLYLEIREKEKSGAIFKNHLALKYFVVYIKLKIRFRSRMVVVSSSSGVSQLLTSSQLAGVFGGTSSCC